MAGRDGRSSRRPRSGSTDRGRTWLLVTVVVVLLVGAGGYHFDVVGRVRDALSGSATPTGPGAGPADVAAPAGVDVPALRAPEPVVAALTPSTTPLDERAVRRALEPLGSRSMGRLVLGKHVRAVVAPLGGGPSTVNLGSGVATPASTTKLVTTTAALLAMGPDHVFTTSVVGSGRRIVLVGGGDPYLERRPDDPDAAGVPERADVTTLARRTAAVLTARGVTRVRLGYDASLFSGPAISPHWEKDYVPDVVAPVSALWVDEGRPDDGYGRVADPALDAARAFAAALGKAGVDVVGAPEERKASGATLASMDSAPLSQIVERILQVSDNEGAEVLLRQTAVAAGEPGSFLAGARARATLLSAHGVDLAPGRGSHRGSVGGTDVLYDGSGLSRDDRLDPTVLLAVLRLDASPDQPDLRAVLTGLPVAGFDGSLADRMDMGPPAGLGRVRAKTGTLTGVTSLAGIAVDLDGTPMVFVLMADRFDDDDGLLARVAMDDAAAGLGACHCG